MGSVVFVHFNSYSRIYSFSSVGSRGADVYCAYFSKIGGDFGPVYADVDTEVFIVGVESAG